ncbi:hypothetical protein LCGC14_1929000 [marine sediment metagenome]|uniref:Uracil-DNA glycosylase-like domain-containing protein n=1 Tax=marine sediment metagenome TaxID=412755 RepID=A0A0F9ILD4_9ZZZZ
MIVQDIGPPDAKILICGEAPGENEARMGKPFVGASGDMLKQMLSHSGIDYAKCFVTNVIDERPPGNNFQYLYEGRTRKVPTDRLREYWKKLREKVKELKPNIVIALGGEALRALTRRTLITSWRGMVTQVDGIKILPTFHPSYVIRQYQDHPIVELDFAKALRESKYSEYHKPHVALVLKPTISQVVGWFNMIENYGANRVSFDIETIGCHVRCMSLAICVSVSGTIEAISIPFIKMPSSSLTEPSDKKTITLTTQSTSASSYWSPEDEITVLDKIAKLFEDKTIEKVGQNSVSFDAPLIESEFGISIKNHSMDLMHLFHCLYAELPKSLSFMCSILRTIFAATV